MTLTPYSLGERLRLAREMRGLTQVELAARANMRQPDLSKLEHGLIAQTVGIARLAAALQVPAEWLELGAGSPPSWTPPGPGAHALSDPAPIVLPKQLDWGSLHMLADLPPTFSLRVADDAMAPDLPAGHLAIFAAGRQPQPDDVVLLRDAAGHRYIRRFQARTPGHWQAVTRAPGYAPLDSVADGLQVLAVQIGALWG